MTRAYQWRPVEPGEVVEASAWVRGKVGVSTRVKLVLSWLDARDRLMVEEQSDLQLPEGDWPDWVQLRQGRRVPDGAKRAGLTLMVMQQGAGDWVEWDDASLRVGR